MMYGVPVRGCLNDEARVWLEADDRDAEGRLCYVLCTASERATTRVRITAKSAAEFLWVEDADVPAWMRTVELYAATD